MAHTTCFRQRTVHIGVATKSEFIWGWYPQNSLKMAMDRQFQTKRPRYVAKYKHDQCTILGECLDYQTQIADGPLWHNSKSKFAGGRRFENRKYAIIRTRIVWSSPNFAGRRRNKRLLQLLTNNAKILKSKMADGRHIANWKSVQWTRKR